MLIYVALGGAAGTLARYGLGSWAQRWSIGFPVGTLLINVIGSLLLGFLMRVLVESTVGAELRVALTIGFCGGFTTFSTFSYESARLLQDGSWGRAASYVLGSVLLSLLATFAGLAAGRLWTAR